jgi:hypothetical protein
MSDKTSGRPGILESAAIVLAVAVASLAVARAQPGLRECTASAVSVSRDAVPRLSSDADATDMLQHD